MLENLAKHRFFKFAPKRWSSVLFPEKKPVFFSKKHTFAFFFSFLVQKTLKIKILTSVWSAQHPNAGRNIQQTSNWEKQTDIVVHKIKTKIGKSYDKKKSSGLSKPV